MKDDGSQLYCVPLGQSLTRTGGGEVLVVSPRQSDARIVC